MRFRRLPPLSRRCSATTTSTSSTRTSSPRSRPTTSRPPGPADRLPSPRRWRRATCTPRTSRQRHFLLNTGVCRGLLKHNTINGLKNWHQVLWDVAHHICLNLPKILATWGPFFFAQPCTPCLDLMYCFLIRTTGATPRFLPMRYSTPPPGSPRIPSSRKS